MALATSCTGPQPQIQYLHHPSASARMTASIPTAPRTGRICSASESVLPTTEPSSHSAAQKPPRTAGSSGTNPCVDVFARAWPRLQPPTFLPGCPWPPARTQPRSSDQLHIVFSRAPTLRLRLRTHPHAPESRTSGRTSFAPPMCTDTPSRTRGCAASALERGTPGRLPGFHKIHRAAARAARDLCYLRSRHFAVWDPPADSHDDGARSRFDTRVFVRLRERRKRCIWGRMGSAVTRGDGRDAGHKVQHGEKGKTDAANNRRRRQ
ncbi:hypothetical protein FKP32DRAFT_444153 [Trametes sanguinea]|nr:hypothetical protein FKP32DRAFT_444153 [Trametes sanguinea]